MADVFEIKETGTLVFVVDRLVCEFCWYGSFGCTSEVVRSSAVTCGGVR